MLLLRFVTEHLIDWFDLDTAALDLQILVLKGRMSRHSEVPIFHIIPIR